MKILVLNCGSSSLKYQLIDMSNEEVLCVGLVERIGIEGSVLKQEKDGVEGKLIVEQPMKNHQDAIKLVLDAVVDPQYGGVKDIKEVEAVGHRVVHGGEKFAGSVLITDEVKAALEECIELAPLHNPANIMGIEACEAILPGVPMVGVFDTAFHQTMPKSSYLYGLGKNIEDCKIITCHLGNGASVAAIDGGKSVDTSMGFTPLEGLIMGTRCGDIDAAILPFLMEKEGLDAKGLSDLMNKKSGVYGMTGISSDFRDIEDAAAQNNELAQVALESYAKKVKKYIGSYAAEMNGVDAVVFTAGVGENGIDMRADIMANMDFLGMKLDEEANKVRGKERVISTEDSKVKILLIPTNEELMIARDTLELVK